MDEEHTYYTVTVMITMKRAEFYVLAMYKYSSDEHYNYHIMGKEEWYEELNESYFPIGGGTSVESCLHQIVNITLVNTLRS